uniref:Germinal center associated signaling and motility n=1 Tax=Oryctolagus cuniculus TaxID=9986 RepID=A0A5F9C559_RABIT
MGNFPRRESRWQQDTQQMPWNLRLQNAKQRASRKKICIFKARQDSQKENEGMSSAPIQENGEQTHPEELCYILINHRVLGARPSGSSAEEYYENISHQPGKPRETPAATETEYSLLRVPPTPRHPPSPEDEYELLMPSRIPCHSLQQPHSRMASLETSVSCLQ